MPIETPKLGLKLPLALEIVNRENYIENLELLEENAASQTEVNSHLALNTRHVNYAADNSSTDTYAITLNPVPTAYTAGMVVNFRAKTVNSGACSLNCNGLGPVPIKTIDGYDLCDGAIKAAQIVQIIYDGTYFRMLSHPAAVPMAKVYNSTAQSVAQGMHTILNFDTKYYDTNGMHDPLTNPTRLTCKTPGTYLTFATIAFEINPTGYREVLILENGANSTGIMRISPATDMSTFITVVGLRVLSVGNYLEVQVRQNSGETLNVLDRSAAIFGMVKLG
jgi:hypothetical protein